MAQIMVAGGAEMMVHPEIVRDLLARIARIGSGAARIGAGGIASELDAIRRVAQAHGLRPAVTVIHALDHVLARGEQGALVHGWLDMLADAVAVGRGDAGADATFAAACCVRQVR